VVEARSPADGVIEAIRKPGPGFVLGVQWHPEFHLSSQEQAGGLLDSGPMMQAFLQAARDGSGRPPPRLPLA
jgi:putative glutamine amidotransferase